MHTTEIRVHTGRRRGVFDITLECERFAGTAAGGSADGLLNAFVPHATAGLVVMELGSGSDDDLADALDRLLPRDDRWRHRHGSQVTAPTTSCHSSCRRRSRSRSSRGD